MSTPNLALLLSQLLANHAPTESEIPVYCVIRISSTHHAVDQIIAVYFDEDEAIKKRDEVIDSLPERSKHKVYIQTSILGK
ncbi:hypothetical protein DQT32_03365 [Salmonella enterica subsp. enterica serovar Braenderup]|nr:hypothetical protein [Salmonella enterica subsp. enterica serovar Braenderup]